MEILHPNMNGYENGIPVKKISTTNKEKEIIYLSLAQSGFSLEDTELSGGEQAPETGASNDLPANN